MADSNLILAGVSAGGADKLTLASFAPYGTAAPTDATSALPTDKWRDAGFITSDGLAEKLAEQSSGVQPYGTLSSVRTLITSSEKSFDITFLETNLTTLEVYYRKDLGSLSTDGAGAVDFTEGVSHALPVFAAVFDIVDGANLWRLYCPRVSNTTPGDKRYSAGATIDAPVTLTAYLDGTAGFSVHHFLVLDALKYAS